jgi:hypothetical protein
VPALERMTRFVVDAPTLLHLIDRVSRRTAWRTAREHGWDELHHAEYLAVAHLQADAE